MTGFGSIRPRSLRFYPDREIQEDRTATDRQRTAAEKNEARRKQHELDLANPKWGLF